MFDNLRDDMEASYYDDDEQANYEPAAPVKSTKTPPRRSSSSSSRMFGLTSFQRFVVSFLILISVCIVGMLCLLATNKIGF